MIEIYKNSFDQYEFKVKAKNHRILVQSEEGYVTKSNCMNAIKSLLENVGVDNIDKEMEKIKDLTKGE